MAIDPKNLRVGTHISVNGERVVVDVISYTHLVAYIKPDGDWEACDPCEEWIEPIPITPELLIEIGFEKHEIHGKEVYRKTYKEIPKLGTMFYALCYNPISEAWDFQAHPTLSECRYLHELEALAYHATKQELIND